MIATPQRLSMWLQAHAVRPKKEDNELPQFTCDGRFHPYVILSAQKDPFPDVVISFGYDPNNDLFFITDDTPKEIRPSILQIEYRRIKHDDHRSHYQALRTSLEGMPNCKIRRLIIPHLLKFYENLHATFDESCEETFESRDIANALKYLRSL